MYPIDGFMSTSLPPTTTKCIGCSECGYVYGSIIKVSVTSAFQCCTKAIEVVKYGVRASSSKGGLYIPWPTTLLIPLTNQHPGGWRRETKLEVSAKLPGESADKG